MRLRLFGSFGVEFDGRVVETGDLARRPRQLVELLALAPEHRRTRDEVVEALFGHLDARAGMANLHKAASLARTYFGDQAAVVLEGGTVALWPGATVETDAGTFERAARDALAGADADDCRNAVAGYAGDLLADERYEAWVEPDRQRLRRLVVDLMRAAGDWARLTELEPTDEGACRELMRSAAIDHDRGNVRREFERLRAALEDLGVGPSEETVRLYEKLTRGPPATAPLAAHGPFVGREVELARARAAWRAAAAGTGGGLLIRGEAGIGKTRLSEALLAEAAAAGWTTMRGSGSRVEAAIPYAPVVEAVGRLLRDRPDLADRLPGDGWTVLDRLTAATSRRGSDGERSTDQQVVSVVARLVAVAAKERGVMLLIDDLHVADDDTVALVHYLIRAATFQCVLVVATLLVGEESAAARQARTELVEGRRAALIELGPLSRDEAATLVSLIAPATSSAGSIAELWDRAGGNPFLLQELAAGGSGRAATVVAARLARMDPALREALAHVAVAGEHLSTDELRVFTGTDDDGARRILDAAVASAILEEDGGGDYRFRHGLVREALLAALPAHRRAAVHRAAAKALEAAQAPAARVAHHLLASDRPAAALPHLVAAAHAAMAVGAYRNARSFVDQALPLGADDAELLTLRADVAFATGDPAAPLNYAAAVAATPASTRGPVLVRQARAHVAAYDPTAATAALAAASVEVPADVALRHLIEAQIAWMGGDLDTCEHVVEEARTFALAHGVMDVVFGAMSLGDLVLHQRGRFPHGFRRDLLEAGSSPILAAVVHDAHLCGAETYLYGGRPYEEVKSFAGELAATAAAAGARRGEAFALTLLGEAELLSGDLTAAEGHLEASIGLHADAGAAGGEALARQRLAQLHLAAGRGVEADALLTDALPLARTNPAVGWHVVPRVYGTMVEASPSPAEAMALVDEGELGTGRGMASVCPPCSISFLLPAAVACAGTGDTDRARRFVAQAEPWVAALWAQGGWQAWLDEARGHLAWAEGDDAAARAHLDAAVDRFMAVGQPLDARRGATTLDQLR